MKMELRMLLQAMTPRAPVLRRPLLHQGIQGRDIEAARHGKRQQEAEGSHGLRVLQQGGESAKWNISRGNEAEQHEAGA